MLERKGMWTPVTLIRSPNPQPTKQMLAWFDRALLLFIFFLPKRLLGLFKMWCSKESILIFCMPMGETDNI